MGLTKIQTRFGFAISLWGMILSLQAFGTSGTSVPIALVEIFSEKTPTKSWWYGELNLSQQTISWRTPDVIETEAGILERFRVETITAPESMVLSIPEIIKKYAVLTKWAVIHNNKVVAARFEHPVILVEMEGRVLKPKYLWLRFEVEDTFIEVSLDKILGPYQDGNSFQCKQWFF